MEGEEGGGREREGRKRREGKKGWKGELAQFSFFFFYEYECYYAIVGCPNLKISSIPKYFSKAPLLNT